MQNKDNKFNRFQLKVFAIWGLIICSIFSLWSIYTPQVSKQGAQWSIERVIEASEKGNILYGEISSDLSKGPQWYRLAGEAKLPNSIVLPNGQETKTSRFEAQGRLTDLRFNTLIHSSNAWTEVPSSTFWTDVLAGILPFIIIMFFLYFFLGRSIGNAGKSAMGFVKSRAKLLTPDNKKVTFDQVAGCDEAKEEVAEIVDFLKNPKKFQDIGGRIPKGCLLIGQPGTGKTLLAKAVAGEANVPFFSMSGSDFVELYVGVGASRVRDLFEQGRKNAPCILFIDEIDAVGRQRGAGLGGGNDEREQTLNSLLVEMDGFDSREGVIIIAATNRADVLDSALLRPGRFDRQIEINMPDLHGREDILKVHAKKIKFDETVDLQTIARHTSGFSGADLENLLNESALLAARRNKKKVSRFEVDEARDRISFGREHRKLMDDKDKKVTAYHESGHAIVQAIVDNGDLPVHKVTILPRGKSLGSTMFIPTKDIVNYTKESLFAQICCAMGGRAAEELTFNEITTGASADIKSATHIARKIVCEWGMSKMGPIAFGANQDHIFLGKDISRSQNYSESTAQRIDAEIAEIIQTSYERAKQIIIEKKSIVEKLANALLEFETIDGKHVYELVKSGEFTTSIEKHQVDVVKTDKPSDDKPSDPKNDDKNNNGDILPIGNKEALPVES